MARKRKPPSKYSTPTAYQYTANGGTITIGSFYVSFEGSIEGAALALAKEIFKPDPKMWWDPIHVSHIDGKYAILLHDTANADSNWPQFKESFEKICNNLAVFM